MRPPRQRPIVLLVAAVAASGLLAFARAADDPSPSPAAASGRLADQAALKPYGGLVGGWRGVGQVERGRTRGAWTEQAEWAWKLSADSAALEGKVDGGKYLKSLVVRRGPGPHAYKADAVLVDDSSRSFAGTGEASKPLVLTAEPPDGPGVRRITITPLHDTRLLVLLEARDPRNRAYHRLGEVGYTRKGVAFAAGESGPVCIVTEGRGTIPVSYKGKTYHVCCTGCRDLFNEAPEAILAEAAARQKARDGDKK